MKKITVSAIIVSGMLLFANCHPKMNKGGNDGAKTTADVKETEVKTAVATPEQMAQGKVIYDAQCAKCHDLPKTTDYTQREWNKILPKMVSKAEMNKADAAVVSAYVYAHVKPM